MNPAPDLPHRNHAPAKHAPSPPAENAAVRVNPAGGVSHVKSRAYPKSGSDSATGQEGPMTHRTRPKPPRPGQPPSPHLTRLTRCVREHHGQICGGNLIQRIYPWASDERRIVSECLHCGHEPC